MTALRPAVTLAALGFTFAILGLGYVAFGLWTMLIFTSGFLGGFLLWLRFPQAPSFARIRTPYVLALCLFVLHRVEEYATGFFARLADITGVETPAVASWPVILLLLFSVGAWLAAPFLLARGRPFGAYLAWTFFAAMGLTELAHLLVFPWFSPEPLAYFPGMASTVLLAPVGWWGMWRMARGDTDRFAPRARRLGPHRPTLGVILRLVVVFAAATALIAGVTAWRDHVDHNQFGPGRIVVSPH